MSTIVINKLINAAENHGEDNNGYTDQVSDLETMVHAMWRLMTPAQKVSFLEATSVSEVIELGARDAFTAESLVSELGVLPEGTSLVSAIEVRMQEVVGDYAVPEEVPEWAWIEANGAFTHRDNGTEGVWEFMVHTTKAEQTTDVPERLKPFFAKALSNDIAWVMFYQ